MSLKIKLISQDENKRNHDKIFKSAKNWDASPDFA